MTSTTLKRPKASGSRQKTKPPAAIVPKCPMEAGRSYAFMFPRHNFSGILSPLELRRLRVESVRDLTKDPIERVTFDIQPLLQRSRFLVTGLDLDKNEERSFYTGSMKEIVELNPEQSERSPITLYVVSGVPFVHREMAKTMARIEATASGNAVLVEAITIPIDLPRKLLKVVKPKAVR